MNRSDSGLYLPTSAASADFAGNNAVSKKLRRKALVANAGGDERDWAETLNNMPHGPTDGDALNAYFAADDWTNDDLSELLGEVLPAYNAALRENAEGLSNSDRQAQAQRLVRIAKTASAELNARTEAEEAAQAALDADLAELEEIAPASTELSAEEQEAADAAAAEAEAAAAGEAAAGDGNNEELTDEQLAAIAAKEEEAAAAKAEADAAAAEADANASDFGAMKRRPSIGELNRANGNKPEDEEEENNGLGGFNFHRSAGDEVAAGQYSNYSDLSFSGMVPTDAGKKALGAEGRAMLDADGNYVDGRHLAVAIANSMNKSKHRTATPYRPNGKAQRVHSATAFATAQTRWGQYITPEMKLEDQYNYIDQLMLEARTNPALVANAAGGCAIPPFTPRRDFIRCAERFSPVRSSLPSINVQAEGGMKYMKPPSWQDAKAGIQITTAAQNAAGYGMPPVIDPETGAVVVEGTIPEGGAPFKACMTMPCPTWYETCVDAMSICVIFDNLQKRVWPELVQNFMRDVEICTDAVMEQYFLSAIDAAATPIVGQAGVYGATRTLLGDGITMRRRMIETGHMSSSQVVNWYVPEWALDNVAIDIINNDNYGLRFLFEHTTDELLTAVRNKYKINIIPYRDEAINCDGESRNQRLNNITVDPDNGDFCLAPLPRNPLTYMIIPGSWAILDGGDFETGEYRDSILNGSNNCAMFSEQWMEIVNLGSCVTLAGVHDLCPTGAGAGPVDPFSCEERLWVPTSQFEANVGSMILKRPGMADIVHTI